MNIKELVVKTNDDKVKLESGDYAVTIYKVLDNNTYELISPAEVAAIYLVYNNKLVVDEKKFTKMENNKPLKSGKGKIVKKLAIYATCAGVLVGGTYLVTTYVINKNNPYNGGTTDGLTPNPVVIETDVEGASLGDGVLDYSTYGENDQETIMAAQLDEAKENNSGYDYTDYASTLDEDLLINLRAFIFNSTDTINEYLSTDATEVKGQAVYVELADAFQEDYDKVVVNYFGNLRNNFLRIAYEQHNKAQTRVAWIEAYNQINDFIFNQTEITINGNVYGFDGLSTAAQVTMVDLAQAIMLSNTNYQGFYYQGEVVDAATYSAHLDEISTQLQYMTDYIRNNR